MSAERWWGLFAVALGVGVIAIAVDLIPVAPESIYAPRWVLAIGGLVFCLGGASIFMRERKILVAAGGTAIVACLGVLSLWAALAGSPEHFSGGLPFLSHETNFRIGRGIFGLSALLCAVAITLGVRQIAQLAKTDSGDT